MSISPRRLGAGELALHVTARHGRGDWLALIVPETRVDAVAEEVATEISGMHSKTVERVSKPSDAGELAEKSGKAASSILVVSGLEHFSEEEWRRVDFARSRFYRDECVVLVLARATADTILKFAPNLASWLSGSLWELDPNAESLSDEEREERLQALREWSGLTDEEVISRAERQELPAEPEFAEWLVLLGRGDLLAR